MKLSRRMVGVFALGCISFMLTACSGAQQASKTYPSTRLKVVVTSHPDQFSDDNGEVGSMITGGSHPALTFGDSVTADMEAEVAWVSALRTDGLTKGTYARVKTGGHLVWVRAEALDNPDCLEVHQMNGIVTVSRSQSDDAWSRVVAWVSNNSSMKVQTSTEYLIETYNPIEYGHIGYRVTRQLATDSVTIEGRKLTKGGAYPLVDCSFYRSVKYGVR